MIPKQILWQIESLWERYSSPSDKKHWPIPSAFSENYDEKGFSKYFTETDSHGPLRFSKDFSPQLSDKIVFSDPSVGQCTGLAAEILWISPNGKPVYLVDNHHFALFPFAEMGLTIGKPVTIVHIDAHRDDALFPDPIQKQHSIPLSDVVHLIERCKVSNFLDAGKRSGLLFNVISVTQRTEFEHFSPPKPPFILSLDLDIFGAEGSAVPLELKVKTIAGSWAKADGVVMATSPGFIDQESALALAKIFITEKNFTFS